MIINLPDVIKKKSRCHYSTRRLNALKLVKVCVFPRLSEILLKIPSVRKSVLITFILNMNPGNFTPILTVGVPFHWKLFCECLIYGPFQYLDQRCLYILIKRAEKLKCQLSWNPFSDGVNR